MHAYAVALSPATLRPEKETVLKGGVKRDEQGLGRLPAETDRQKPQLNSNWHNPACHKKPVLRVEWARGGCVGSSR
jgi:hypothetical protein